MINGYFTRSHLQDTLAASGFCEIQIRNVYGPYNFVFNMLDHEFRRAHLSTSSFPVWARNKILSICAQFSHDFVNENPYSCSIVARKSEQNGVA